ncbi:MAG: heavy metal translocating P-type ATPase [Pseudomonadota bacterium]
MALDATTMQGGGAADAADAAAASAPGGCCSGAKGAVAAAGPLPTGDRLELGVDGMRCAACIAAVERAARAVPGIAGARVNLSQRRLAVIAAEGAEIDQAAVIAAVSKAGYPAREVDKAALDALDRDEEGRALLVRLGVTGFAAMNVMLLSVALWAGADGSMARLLLLMSMVLAVPATLWSGQPFFASAWGALSRARLNMDVPISLAILTALGVSTHAALTGEGEGWFEAATALVFFLLAGRYLDHRARRAARSAAVECAALRPRTTRKRDAEGHVTEVAVADLAPGDHVVLMPGDRAPADGRIIEGESEIDRALVTGESVPVFAAPGDELMAGMAVASGRGGLGVERTGRDTFLADLERMIAAAETAEGRTQELAAEATRLYAPGVHAIAALAAVGWLLAGATPGHALMIAAATLIITCPCALGLAIPVVQAVAGGRLFKAGIFLKDGGALETLAKVDTVVFDKTGTLTEGRPRLVAAPEMDHPAWPVAAALAAGSRHPMARAIGEAAEAHGITAAKTGQTSEIAGQGIEATLSNGPARLGRSSFVGALAGRSIEAEPERPKSDQATSGTVVWLSMPGEAPVSFQLEDALRADAAETVAALRKAGCRIILMSGDRAAAVESAARAAGIDEVVADLTPADKIARVQALQASGHTVAMVGDGLNDAPALAAADVSLAPASAAGVSEAAAGIVYLGQSTSPVITARRTAITARRRMVENLWMSGLYNVFAIPLAVAGYATPLIAALAMSSSSILVTVNALRMGRKAGAEASATTGAPPKHAMEIQA